MFTLGTAFNIKHFIYQPGHLELNSFLLMALKYSGFDSRGFLNVMKKTGFYDLLRSLFTSSISNKVKQSDIELKTK